MSSGLRAGMRWIAVMLKKRNRGIRIKRRK